MAEALADSQVLSICNSELSNTSESSELSNQRADALDRYLGEPYGDEVDGRSQVVTREVYETVEGLMPSLMRIFAETDNLVTFEPTGPEDEEQARQESDIVSHIFWNENQGFHNLYSFCKDALLSKVGVLKVWADRSESEEREEYKGLDDLQLGQLMADDTVEREVLEYELTEEGHHIVFRTTKDEVKIRICPVAPEEFGIKRDARSPYIADSTFSYCRFKKTLGELREEGYDEDFLLTLATEEELDTEERIARRNLEDEQESLGWSDEWTMRNVWVSECYVRMDRNGDGMAELLQVTIAGGAYNGQSGKLMDIEEIDAVPLFATPAVPITHKFYGLSMADVVMDLQEIQTTLLRQVLDNTYLANNGQTAANTDHVNIEDLLTRRPGGIVRYEGDMAWSAVVGAIPHNPLPQQTGEVFERLDERQKRRTGYGDEVGMLDTSALAQMNTGVAALAFDMARGKIELLARIIAEIGLKPMFHRIHELMIKEEYKARAFRLRNQWVETNPAEWRTRTNSSVQIGIGKVSKERRIMGAEAILDKQRQLTAEGAMGTILMPHHVYEANRMWVEAWGFEPDLFLQDPRKLPPPPPKQPDANQQLAQAQASALMMDGQSKMLRAQNEQAKLQLEAGKARMEAQYRQAESFLKQQIEALRADTARMKAETDAGAKVVSMEHQSAMQAAGQQIDALKVKLDHLNATRDRDLDYFQTMLQAHNPNLATPEEMQAREEAMAADQAAQEAAEAQKVMEQESRQGERDAAVVRMFEGLYAKIDELNGPKEIEYDDNGLMKSLGGKPVIRDDSGRVRRLG